MSYRHLLLDATRQFEGLQAEPSVLDYLQLQNQECLRAWHDRKLAHFLRQASGEPWRAGASINARPFDERKMK